MQTTEHQPSDAIRVSRHYPASADRVWHAWTDPQALSRWFSPPGGKVTSTHADLRVGGAYRIGFDTPDGKHNEVGGIYQEVVADRRLVFTWAWHSTPDRVSRITIDLMPAGDGTELRFVHDRFFDASALENHSRGWPSFLDRLGDYLQSNTREA